jgi:hypothetical protein
MICFRYIIGNNVRKGDNKDDDDYDYDDDDDDDDNNNNNNMSSIPGNHEVRELQKQPYWALHTYFGKC